MKPRIYDALVQSAVELSCYGTGQSTIDEARTAYQAWLREHDRGIAERAYDLGESDGIKWAQGNADHPRANPYRKMPRQ
ncbi:MAG: hypothetical protein E7D48_04070 [Bifidobacterium scardovii]|jgi:hypothetical protein|uniref:hypothetical protein n=1 Tax=Bifidobacterium scardovii TaxID=158787 RepID=UPI0020480F41|nr:hypothetical protein [Bifidobacterium scardovii]MDU2421278.1 hypothetical protein [Bifidobacterium scardovii]DAZ29436.1 MAG TPA: hypothetical protein [Caudoviricetes sp.]